MLWKFLGFLIRSLTTNWSLLTKLIITMDDDNLGAEFCDVLSTMNVSTNASNGMKGMSSYLKNEIQKQLDVNVSWLYNGSAVVC